MSWNQIFRNIPTLLLVAVLFTSAVAFAERRGNTLNRVLSIRGQILSSYSGVTEGFFSQRLDHFNALNSETWEQRYFIDDSNFKPQGPVFFLLGGEGPISASYATGTLAAHFARQFGGIVVALEHRYYGRSVPRNQLSTANLQYLSTEQAVADAALFRQFIAGKYNSSTFISVGGSYSGNLAAFVRIRYPHLFLGALASSAPVRAKLNFYEYMDVVADSLGADCTGRVKQATKMIEQMTQSESGRQSLATLFSTCKQKLGTSDLDLATFFEELTDPICEIVQYNSRIQYNITKFCGEMLQSNVSNLVATYARAVKTVLRGQCIQDSYDSYIQNFRDVSPTGSFAAARAWTWQVCTEYGYLQTAETSKQPFSSHITLNFFLKMCEDLFQVKTLASSSEYINTVFGADQPAGSNIVFTNGLVDPWHVLSVLRDVDSTQIAYVMPGQSHCSDFSAPSASDPPVLKQVHQKLAATVSHWVNHRK